MSNQPHHEPPAPSPEPHDVAGPGAIAHPSAAETAPLPDAAAQVHTVPSQTTQVQSAAHTAGHDTSAPYPTPQDPTAPYPTAPSPAWQYPAAQYAAAPFPDPSAMRPATPRWRTATIITVVVAGVVVMGLAAAAALYAVVKPTLDTVVVVERYFAAVAEGDVDTLADLALRDDDPVKGLTSEAVRRAAERGPVEYLLVTPTGDPSLVYADYEIDGYPIAIEVWLTQTDDGWKMDDVTGMLPVDWIPAGVSLSANDVDLPPVLAPGLTPGLWDVTTDHPFFTVEPGQIMVSAPGYEADDYPDVLVTPDGAEKIREAGQALFDACESPKPHDNSHCGLSDDPADYTIEGHRAVLSTLRCTVNSGRAALKRAEFTSWGDGTVWAEFQSRLGCTSTLDDGSTGYYSFTFEELVADLTQPTDVVVWLA